MVFITVNIYLFILYRAEMKSIENKWKKKIEEEKRKRRKIRKYVHERPNYIKIQKLNSKILFILYIYDKSIY